MFTDLAFIDWAALLIALALLAVTGVATYLAYAASTEIALAPESQHPPRHSAPGQSPLLNLRRSSLSPAHASTGPAHASTDLGACTDAPAPPIVKHGSTRLSHLRSTPRDPTPVVEAIEVPVIEAVETVAERAARLRRRGTIARTNRPVAESEPIHKAVRSRHEQESLTFAGAGSKLSAELETAPGFSIRGPGFFEDPIGRHELRYWDGCAWTEYVKEGDERFTDPL